MLDRRNIKALRLSRLLDYKNIDLFKIKRVLNNITYELNLSIIINEIYLVLQL